MWGVCVSCSPPTPFGGLLALYELGACHSGARDTAASGSGCLDLAEPCWPAGASSVPGDLESWQVHRRWGFQLGRGLFLKVVFKNIAQPSPLCSKDCDFLNRRIPLIGPLFYVPPRKKLDKPVKCFFLH